MPIIGYHASHEQIDPASLLKPVISAEQSGFARSWRGAALQATWLPFGVVNAPGQRYHPAIIAQAGATLAQMFPDRFWMALGSGEAVNEHITGHRWPEK